VAVTELTDIAGVHRTKCAKCQVRNHAELPLCNAKLDQPVFYADPSELTLAGHL
jgi:hypothetical protein